MITPLGIWTWNGAKPYMVPTLFLITELATRRVTLTGIASMFTPILHLRTPRPNPLERQTGTLSSAAFISLGPILKVVITLKLKRSRFELCSKVFFKSLILNRKVPRTPANFRKLLSIVTSALILQFICACFETPIHERLPVTREVLTPTLPETRADDMNCLFPRPSNPIPERHYGSWCKAGLGIPTALPPRNGSSTALHPSL